MKKKKKKFKFGLVIFIIGAVLFGRIVIEQQKVLNKGTDDLKSLQAKMNEVEKDNKELENEKNSLFTDKNMERVARDKLGMVKPGEKVFVDVGK